MYKKLSAGLLALAGATALGGGVASAATTVSPEAASACVVAHGTKDSTRTWTEHFTTNCAYLRVRARVICHDKLTGDESVDYGGVLNGTGTSSYRCNSIEYAKSGHGQYFNFQKWVNLPH